jgi:pyruvate/2-oxoacid:ferredoxin oxidoreductase beta subunit
VTPLSSYRNEGRYPFCPGCGHEHILDKLNTALVKLALDPRQIVIVSDIGCSGLSDQYFTTDAFHGLHGRSITYATGIKLARPDLKVIVTMGDGGTGIGGAHLLAAARRNIGITVLVFNNFNFGMTGGQHSATTPPGAVTSTTPGGNLERPLDLCATVAANGAGYVWRGTNFDADLPDRIAEAIQSESFAVLDIWELCTAYYLPANKASKKTLRETLDTLGFAVGLIQRKEFPEYAAALRHASPMRAPAVRGIEARFDSSLVAPFHLVLAGSAGGKVRSAARTVAEAAILSGLYAAQRDDYPITVKTGHSLSELVMSPREIHYSGAERPDALLILSADGLAKSKPHLAAMRAEDHVFVVPELGELRTAASVHVIDPMASPVVLGPARIALYAAAVVVRTLGLFALEALAAAVTERGGEGAQVRLDAIRAAAPNTRGSR